MAAGHGAAAVVRARGGVVADGNLPTSKHFCAKGKTGFDNSYRAVAVPPRVWS